MTELSVEIKKRLDKGEPLYSVKLDLIKHGYLERDVEEALHFASVDRRSSEMITERRNSIKVFLKEVMDRIGFGFGSQQFINILFYLMQAPLFLILLLNGVKSVVTMVLSTFLHEHAKSLDIRKRAITWAGLVFSISFAALGLSIFLNSITLFAIVFLVNAMFLVFYGDFYYSLVLSEVRLERAGHFLKRFSEYGIIITALALLTTGFLLHHFHETGYILVMVLASLPFMVSMIILYFITVKPRLAETTVRLGSAVRSYFGSAREHIPVFLKDKVTLVLILSGAITSIIQTIGNAFYGIYIYQYLYSDGFTGFMNVAVIFVIALIASLFASFFVQKMSTNYGKFPMLVFGTLLVAITPLAYYFNPNFIAISVATAIGIFGSSFLGTARGLLAIDLLPEEKRKHYYALSGLLFAIPSLIITAIFAYVVHFYQFKFFFLLLALTLIIFVTPMYMYILIINHKVKKI